MASGENWYWLRSGRQAAAVNMAWDEALLAAVPELGAPVLRFYGWTEPAASLGYFQRYAEVESMTVLRPLVRRPTGGGVVAHDHDWTYALVFPTTHPWYRLRARASYAQVHEWLQRAFARLGLITQLSPTARGEAAGQCFVGAVQNDVLWQDRKIAGAAQRRTRSGLLIQGSVQPPVPTLRREDWEQAVTWVAGDRWGVQWLALQPDRQLLEHVALLVHEKYSRPAHNQRC